MYGAQKAGFQIAEESTTATIAVIILGCNFRLNTCIIQKGFPVPQESLFEFLNLG